MAKSQESWVIGVCIIGLFLSLLPLYYFYLSYIGSEIKLDFMYFISYLLSASSILILSTYDYYKIKNIGLASIGSLLFVLLIYLFLIKSFLGGLLEFIWLLVRLCIFMF